MKVGRWSTTAASNNNTPPDGWPEGQAPSTVNDCAREMMASIRTMINDLSFIDLAHSCSRTSATTFTVPGDVTSFYDVGRRVKCFDASTFYGTVISASFTTNTGVTLRLDSGSLTTSMTSIAVSVLSNRNMALPENAMRVRNALVNGALDVWQEGSSFNISGGGVATVVYTADMFSINMQSTASLNVTRSERSANASNVPTLAQTGLFLNHSMCISVSAADAAIAAGDFCYVPINIEGYTWSKIGHKPNMFTFWANTNRTGTYCIVLRNSGNDRSYIQEFNISAASTWEQKTFTIPEAPTAGTWNYSVGSGLEVGITLAAGTTHQTTNAGQWTATAVLATANQINFLGSAGHTIRFADFRYYEGTQILPMEPVTFQEELYKCRRYFQKSYNYSEVAGTTGVGYGFGFNLNNSVPAGVVLGTIRFDTPMCGNGTPAVTFYSPNSGNSTRAYDGAASDFSAAAVNTNQHGFIIQNGLAGNQLGFFIHWTVSNRLK